MAKLKKVDPEWSPSENPHLKVGEIVEITDYTKLVKTQKAVLVDDAGNEIPLPGEEYQCGVCFKKIAGSLINYTEHVIQEHSPKPKEAPVAPEVTVQSTPAPVQGAPITETEKVDTVASKRLAALEKARAARLAQKSTT